MLSDYELFVQVVESGSLSAAGRIVKLSPAMVSKRLARLEARLGVRLINRTTRRLATTDVGQQFYETVLSILAASREAENIVAGRTGVPSGRLRVSAPTSFGRMHIAPYLKGFMEKYPRLELELDLSDGFADLMTDRIDVAIRITATIDKSFVAHYLAPNQRILCCAPAYLADHEEPQSLETLNTHRILAASSQLPWRLDGPSGPITLSGKSFVQTNSSEVVRELAVAGLGIALRSTWDISQELRDGKLQRILPDYQGSTDVAIYAVYPRTPLRSPKAQAFAQYFSDLYAQGLPWA